MKAKLMQELSLTADQVGDMTLAEISLYGVETDMKKRDKMYSLHQAVTMLKLIKGLTPEERLEFLERKYILWQ